MKIRTILAIMLIIVMLMSFLSCARKKSATLIISTTEVSTPETTTSEITTSADTTSEVITSEIVVSTTTEPSKTSEEDGEFAFLSVDEKQAILDARREMKNKKLPLSHFNLMYDYYGKYGDCQVFFACGEFYLDQNQHTATTKEVTITVDCVEFKYRCSSKNISIFVYKDGEALNITEAFDEGWLTSADIRRIAELHSTEHWTGSDGHQINIDFPNPDAVSPTDAEPGSLSDEVMENFISHLSIRSSYNINNVIHCGNYGGVAVFMYASDGDNPTVYDGPNGERFEYKNNFKFILFKGNSAQHSIFPIQLGGFLEDADIEKVAQFVSSLS